MTGGWIDARYHFMSWCLSCLLVRRHFGSVGLVTDVAGRHLLIDLLELPYDSVSLALEAQQHAMEEMWVLCKLYVYSLQEEPFLHIDGDAFLWHKPGEDFLQAPLICQNLEIGHTVYQDCLVNCQAQDIRFPEFMKSAFGNPIAANAGIIGGTQYSFFKELYQEALAFVAENKHRIRAGEGLQQLPTCVEQLFYPYLAAARGVPVSTLMKPSFRGLYQHLMAFINIYDRQAPAPFVHLLGTFKQQLFYCKQVEAQLLRLFPRYHRKVTELLDNGRWQFTEVRLKLHPLHEKRIPDLEFLDHHVLQASRQPFRRTNRLIGQYRLPLPPVTAGNQETVREALQVLDPFPGLDRVSDCFFFEQARYENLQEALLRSEQRLEEERQRHNRFGELFDRPPAERLEDTVGPGDGSMITGSQWNWHRPEDEQPGNYLYETVVNYHTFYMQEFLQDEFSASLIRLTRKRIPVGQLLEELGKLSAQPLTPMSRAALLQKLDNRIREMYLNGTIWYESAAVPVITALPA